MRNAIKLFAPTLLILLFVYAGVSKLLTFSEFRGQLHNQTFPGWMADLLLYALIPLELLTAVLLSISRTQRTGLQSAVVLLASFTGYIALVMLHFWDRTPCSCGGILQRMSWGQHLVFNIFFLILAVAAILLPESSGRKNLT